MRWMHLVLACAFIGCASDGEEPCIEPGAACDEGACGDGAGGACDAPASAAGALDKDRSSGLHGVPFVAVLAVYDRRAGSVAATSQDPGAHCWGSLCLVKKGSTVVLKETPAPGVDFYRWSGCTDSLGAPPYWPTLTLADVRTSSVCKALFRVRVGGSVHVPGQPKPSPLIITTDGEPADVVCQPNNSCLVPYGSNVTFRALAQEGGAVVTWSGCVTDRYGPTLVIEHVTSTQQCFATLDFAATVSWTVTPVGGGSVQPGPLQPGETCTTSSCVIRLYRTFSLTAQPAQGHHFVGWSGCSSSTSPTIDLNVAASTQCDAHFDTGP